MIAKILQKFLYISLTITLNLLFLVACSTLRGGNVLPVVKVGLIAPFEGSQRTAAYDSLFAVKLAIKEHNDMNRTTGPLVELIALNDNLQPTDAKQQALQMVIDPEVLGVVGPWMGENAEFSKEIYQQANLSVLYPFSPSENVSSFESRSTWAYDKMTALLMAIRDAYLDSNLTRQSVGEKLK